VRSRSKIACGFKSCARNFEQLIVAAMFSIPRDSIIRPDNYHRPCGAELIGALGPNIQIGTNATSLRLFEKKSIAKFGGTLFCLLAKLLSLAVTVSILCAGSASAAFYVSPSGSDNNSGTQAAPWLTINHGISQLQSGGTLYVRAGTYNETPYISGPSGTAAQPTTIMAYNGEAVIIKGPGVDSGRVKITNCSYVIFDGFQVTNFNQGIFVESASNIIVRNCSVYLVGQEGIEVHYGSSFVTIDYCTVHDTRQWMYNGEGIYIGTGDSAPLDNTHNVTVTNCTIYNTPDEGVELKIGTHDCIVDHNDISRVNLGSNWSQNGPNVGAVEVNESVGAVQVWNANPNHIVRNNLIHDLRPAMGTGIRQGTGSTAYNNVIWNVGAYGIFVNNNSSDTYTRFTYNNTIDMPTASAVVNTGGTQILHDNIGPAGASNLPTNPAYFVNEATHDYHLVAGSAPIDAGVNTGIATDRDGVSRPQGSAYDIGAYEYVATPKPYGREPVQRQRHAGHLVSQRPQLGRNWRQVPELSGRHHHRDPFLQRPE